MRLLLVSVNRLISPYPVYPLGLDYVIASVGPGHEIRVVDLVASPDEQALIAAIADFDPQLVGLSLRNIDNTDSAASRGFIDELCRVLAVIRGRTDCPVVLGGAGFTLFPELLLETCGADYGVVGEGERFAALLAALEQGRAVDGLPGVITRQAGGPSRAAVPAPLDGAGRRALPDGPERTSFYLQRGGMLNLQTKRGCPFACFYCTYPLIEGRKLRRVEPADAAEEALGLAAAGARYLFLADSVFNSDHAHALAVAEAFERAGLAIPWGAFFAPLAAPQGFYQSLARCGCTHVEFGTDTLSPAMLATYRKAFSVDDVLASHRAAVAAGLHVAHYFLLGGPGESSASVDETLERADRLERSVRFFFCGIRIYPGTELWRMAVADGQIGPKEDLLAPVFYRPERISAEELIAQVRGRAADRVDWVIGAGGVETDRILERMHARGRTGPLWEFLIR